MSGLSLLGCDDEVVGDAGLWGGIFKAAGGIAQGAIEAKEADDKADADKSSSDAKVSAAIAADNSYAMALARSNYSAQMKSSSLTMDKAASDLAAASADNASKGLSDDAQAKRAAAADKALQAAIDKSHAKPTDKYLAAIAGAWTVVANKAHNNVITSSDDSGDSGGGKKGKGKKGDAGGESWWTRPVIGPLPGTAVAIGGAGVAVGLGFLVKRLLSRGAE